jgi:hypothetical protein
LQAWKKKGANDIKILGIEDKHQIIVVVSSAASGEILPLQIIFTSTIQHCLPKPNISKSDSLSASFHFTYFGTHWSTLEIYQQFV